MVLGAVLLLAGVLHILNKAEGISWKPRPFAPQRSYDQVKNAWHETLPLGGSAALGGFLLIVVGYRLRAESSKDQAGAEGDDSGGS